MNGLNFTDSDDPFKKDSSELEALKLRTDYAWKWFSYHASQRTSMFNYSLIVIGILANAYVTALKEGMVVPAIVIAALGAITCWAFVMLDLRNKSLVNTGEEMLRYLEKRQLFTLDSTTDATQVMKGLLNRSKASDIEDEQKSMRIFYSQAACSLWKWGKTLLRHALLGRHGALIPIMELLFCLAFVLGAVFAAPLVQQVKPSTSKVEVKLAPMDETLRADVIVLKAQTEGLQLQLTAFEKATQNSLARIEAKGKRALQSKDPKK